MDKDAENRIKNGEDFKQQYLKAWHNFQDNVGQKEVEKYYEAVGNMYYDCFLHKNSGIKAIGLESADEETKMQALIAFLKMYKFLQEKRGEGE